jgi:hypothetical protein
MRKGILTASILHEVSNKMEDIVKQLVDLDVGKPVARTAFGFTLCREEYKLEISASETDLWSSLLESYFILK